MASSDDCEFSWGIGCVNRTLIEERRGVSDDERQEIWASIDYVESFVHSPFARLGAAVDDYFAYKDSLTGALAEGLFPEWSEESPLSDKISQILYRFRAYTDRTRYRLKRAYGPHSAELKAFDQAEHDAYRQSLANRLVTYLRNEDQHARPVVRVTGTGGMSVTGERVHIVETSVCDDVLDDATRPRNRRDERQKQLAEEVGQLRRPVVIDPLLKEFMDSMAMIEAARLVAEADRIEKAIAVLRAVSEEVACQGSRPALIGIIVKEVNGQNTPTNMRVTPLSLSVAGSLESALKNARELVVKTT